MLLYTTKCLAKATSAPCRKDHTALQYRPSQTPRNYWGRLKPTAFMAMWNSYQYFGPSIELFCFPLFVVVVVVYLCGCSFTTSNQIINNQIDEMLSSGQSIKTSICTFMLFLILEINIEQNLKRVVSTLVNKIHKHGNVPLNKEYRMYE